MSHSSTKAVLAAVAFAWLWIGAAPARGDLITDLSVDVSHAANGLYTYSYSLSVEPGSTLGAGELDLAVSTFANLSAISAPAGWDVFYTPGSPGDSVISFSSPDLSTDLGPGMVGLFSMASSTVLIRTATSSADSTTAPGRSPRTPGPS
jgi:hypothetical protein